MKVGDVVKVTVWNNPKYSDSFYGLITGMYFESWDLSHRYIVLSSAGSGLYDKQEITIISKSCEADETR